MRQKQGGKKSKRKDERPARKRYWAKRQLENNKVSNLIKYCGFDEKQYKEVVKHWRSVRTTRVPAGYLK